MSIDVLIANAFLEDTVVGEANLLAAYNPAYDTAYAIASSQSFLACLSQNPNNTSLYSSIPLMTAPAGTVLVCDTSGYFRCGASCSWTVPAGITTAQFQLWGAGSNSSAHCCCGGGISGGSGAYASVIMPVTAGSTYTMCAGCAYCCYPTPAGSFCGCGYASYVTGPGLTNLCAMGGTNVIIQNVIDMGLAGVNCSGNGMQWCTWQASVATIAGQCICGNNLCGQSCASCGYIPIHAAPTQTYYGTATGGTVYGIVGMHGGGCWTSDLYGLATHPPVIGPNHLPFGSPTGTNGCCGCGVCYSSESCWGGCLCKAENGVMQFPGAGGFAQHAMGTGIYGCGDAGRMGMVRVMYK